MSRLAPILLLAACVATSACDDSDNHKNNQGTGGSTGSGVSGSGNGGSGGGAAGQVGTGGTSGAGGAVNAGGTAGMTSGVGGSAGSGAATSGGTSAGGTAGNGTSGASTTGGSSGTTGGAAGNTAGGTGGATTGGAAGAGSGGAAGNAAGGAAATGGASMGGTAGSASGGSATGGASTGGTGGSAGQATGGTGGSAGQATGGAGGGMGATGGTGGSAGATGGTGGASCDPAVLSATLRDFKGYDQTGGHPDFQNYRTDTTTGVQGIVKGKLGSDRKPVYKPNGPFIGPNGRQQTTSKADFDQWYRDTPGVNQRIPYTLSLNPGSTVSFSDSNFFPIDGQGFGNYGSTGHNYHFTIEVHSLFDYTGGETFSFETDDDLWVFINGQLAVDLGGVHPVVSQSVDLDSIASAFGLQVGNEYAIDMFHADRRTYGSAFAFSIGFSRANCDPSIGQ